MIRNDETNTFPIVFHAPGSSRKKITWLSLLKYALGQASHDNPNQSIPVPRYAIITWSNQPAGSTCLEKTLAAYGIKPSKVPTKKDPAAYTNGTPPFFVLRKNVQSWNNREHKVGLTNSVLPKLLDAGIQFVIGVDAFDVIFTAHPDEAVRRFVSWPYIENDGRPLPKMMYNASVVRYPQDEPMMQVADELERHIVEKRRHLNAGVWIAETSFACDFWKAVSGVDMDTFLEGNRRSEQAAVRFIARSPEMYPAVQVDRNCRIFQHMAGAKLQML